MIWLLMPLVILSSGIIHAKGHHNKHLCQEIATVYKDARDAGILSNKEVNDLIRSCYRNAGD